MTVSWIIRTVHLCSKYVQPLHSLSNHIAICTVPHTLTLPSTPLPSHLACLVEWPMLHAVPLCHALAEPDSMPHIPAFQHYYTAWGGTLFRSQEANCFLKPSSPSSIFQSAPKHFSECYCSHWVPMIGWKTCIASMADVVVSAPHAWIWHVRSSLDSFSYKSFVSQLLSVSMHPGRIAHVRSMLGSSKGWSKVWVRLTTVMACVLLNEGGPCMGTLSQSSNVHGK